MAWNNSNGVKGRIEEQVVEGRRRKREGLLLTCGLDLLGYRAMNQSAKTASCEWTSDGYGIGDKGDMYCVLYEL
jgi:hypothetical protein